jgi:hypothetical protein
MVNELQAVIKYERGVFDAVHLVFDDQVLVFGDKLAYEPKLRVNLTADRGGLCNAAVPSRSRNNRVVFSGGGGLVVHEARDAESLFDDGRVRASVYLLHDRVGEHVLARIVYVPQTPDLGVPVRRVLFESGVRHCACACACACSCACDCIWE